MERSVLLLLRGLSALFDSDCKLHQTVWRWSLGDFGPDIRGRCCSLWWCSNWVRVHHTHFRNRWRVQTQHQGEESVQPLYNLSKHHEHVFVYGLNVGVTFVLHIGFENYWWLLKFQERHKQRNLLWCCIQAKTWLSFSKIIEMWY